MKIVEAADARKIENEQWPSVADNRGGESGGKDIDRRHGDGPVTDVGIEPVLP